MIVLLIRSPTRRFFFFFYPFCSHAFLSLCKPQRYHQLSRMAQALDVLLPLVQDVAEMHGSGGSGISYIGVVPEMGDEDHALLDRLERRKALVKRSISDMTSRSFGSIFRRVAV